MNRSQRAWVAGSIQEKPYLGIQDLIDIEAGKAYGFPAKISEAFLRTADDTNSVVMSRAPGAASTSLIEDGYDLKGYQIKAKSCNWGPMAGFLCQLPALNKAGAEKIDYNNKNYAKYFEYLRSTNLTTPPFIPLKISDARLKEILDEEDSLATDKKYVPRGSFGRASDNGMEIVYGVAHSADNSVVMEYLALKEANLWAIYHRNVFFKKGGDFADFWEVTISVPAGGASKQAVSAVLSKDDNTATVTQACLGSTLWKQLNMDMASWLQATPFSVLALTPRDFHPLRVAQNPFPPYAPPTAGANDKTYKNAVTGDYDLFAIWPVVPVIDYRQLIRISEDGTPADAGMTQETTLFDRVPGKCFALRSTQSNNVYIEFIPGFKEIEQALPSRKAEDPEYGNYNGAVFTAAQTLNSHVLLQYQGKVTPNAAFHSDEGGRPGIDEIDLPVVAYLPRSLLDRIERSSDDRGRPRMIVIDTPDRLASLVRQLRGFCYVPLNYIWVMQLFVLLKGADHLNELCNNAEGDFKEYLEKRIEELALMKADDIKALRETLRTIFTGYIPKDPNQRASLLRGLNEGRQRERVVTGRAVPADLEIHQVANAENESRNRAERAIDALSNAFTELAQQPGDFPANDKINRVAPLTIPFRRLYIE